MAVLVVNAGSTSLKLHLVDGDEATPVDSIEVECEAVAHRVVHGGPWFREPIVVDAGVEERIRELEEMAPLHNAPALRAIEEARRLHRGIPHVAVFDTAFHSTIPAVAAVYAVPRRWREEWGIRRYGFHGLSVQWVAERVRVPRLVVCHLGGGSSVTAVRDGHSVDTTMGFSPLEGVPMATRSGSIDPGALLYVLRHRHPDPEAIEHDLNFESGLKALGGSGDVRELEPEGLALQVFTYRVAGAVAAMAAAFGGLDALVFTAGIGEGSAFVREQVCGRLGFLGIEIDKELNGRAKPDCEIAADSSAARVNVIHAREELVAARAARALLASLA